MSVTITFLTYSSYTSQSTAIFIPVYLFIARQSRDHAWDHVRLAKTEHGTPPITSVTDTLPPISIAVSVWSNHVIFTLLIDCTVCFMLCA